MRKRIYLTLLMLLGLEHQQAFTVLGHPGYKHFVRLCVHPNGRVEAWTIGKDDVFAEGEPLLVDRFDWDEPPTAGPPPDFLTNIGRPLDVAVANGQAASLDYRKPAEGDADVKLQTTLDDAGRARLGFDLGPAVSGSGDHVSVFVDCGSQTARIWPGSAKAMTASPGNWSASRLRVRCMVRPATSVFLTSSISIGSSTPPMAADWA